MIKINLLPKEILEKEKGKKLIFLIALVCAGLVSVVLGVYSIRVIKYNGLNSRLKVVEGELKPLEEVIKQVDEIEEEKKKLNTKIGVIKTLLTESLLYPRLMQDISGLIPWNVWLTELKTSFKKDELILRLKLYSTNNYGVARFTALLEDSEKFNKVEMGDISSSQTDKGVEIRNFSIKCVYIHSDKKG